MVEWKMHSKQADVWQDGARFKTLCAGRRGGKSELGVMMIGAVGRDLALKGKDGVMWVVLPTSSELTTIWRKFLNIIPDFWITDKSGTEKRPDFLKMNDILIQFKSADAPERLVAEGLRYAWLDEAGIMLRDNEIWAEYIRPTLIDYEAPAFISGTPKGKNKFFELFNKGQDNQKENYSSFHWSSYANPFIPEKEIDSIVDDMPERVYKQEILAEFLDDSSTVFRGINEVVSEGYSDKDTVAVGIDLAKAEDFTVLIGMDENFNVTFFDRFNEVKWKLQKKRIKMRAEQNSDAFFLIDSTGVGDPIVEELENDGVDCEGYHFTNKSKSQLIEGLEISIEDKKINLPNEDVLINELKSFTYNVTRSGKMRYEAPSGMHDDCVMALGLARMALKKKEKNNFEILL